MKISTCLLSVLLVALTQFECVAQDTTVRNSAKRTISEKEKYIFQNKIKDWKNTAKSLENFSGFVDIDEIKKIAFDLDNVKKVNLRNELSIIFDPERQACPLPDKIKAKLLKDKGKGKQFIPLVVRNATDSLPDAFYSIPGKSLGYILHTIELTTPSGVKYQRVLTKAPQYSSMNFEQFIDGASNTFFYSLDCSGYINAAISVTGAMPGMGDLQSKAESALRTGNAMFVAGGIVISPLYAAFTGEIASLNAQERIAILKSLTSLYDIEDADTVNINIGYEAVWGSGNGSSNFNGSGDLKGSVGVSAGVASISGSSSGGGKISRSSSFVNFNTYIIPGFPLPLRKNPTVRMIKDLIATLELGKI